jgi:hypothetical protein
MGKERQPVFRSLKACNGFIPYLSLLAAAANRIPVRNFGDFFFVYVAVEMCVLLHNIHV